MTELYQAGIAEAPENTFADVLDSDSNLVEPKYETVRVNLIGVLNTVKLAIHYMRRQPNGGSVVVTTSTAGYRSAAVPVYTSTKHGIVGMMRSLRTYLVPLKIRLNCIAPGVTDTAIFTSDSSAYQSPDYPALGALYLHQHDDMHARTICIHGKKFRELESGYEAASDMIYGKPVDSQLDFSRPVPALQTIV